MNIVYYPNEILTEPAYPVAEDYPDGELRQIIGDMKLLMYKHRGVGLAANQVGLPMRIFVMDKQIGKKGKDFLYFINPVLLSSTFVGATSSSNQTPLIDREGCLSAPGFSTVITRSSQVKLEWENTDRVKSLGIFEGREAKIIQHEMDHLDGKCIVDRAPLQQRIHYLSLLR